MLTLMAIFFLLGCNPSIYIRSSVISGHVDEGKFVLTNTMALGEADLEIFILNEEQNLFGRVELAVVVKGTQNRVSMVDFYEIVDSTNSYYDVSYIGKTDDKGVISVKKKQIKNGLIFSLLGFRAQKIIV